MYDSKRNSIKLYLLYLILNLQLPKIKFEKYNVPFPERSPCESAVKPKEENDFTVRGRVFDQTKPETFNQVNF